MSGGTESRFSAGPCLAAIVIFFAASGTALQVTPKNRVDVFIEN